MNVEIINIIFYLLGAILALLILCYIIIKLVERNIMITLAEEKAARIKTNCQIMEELRDIHKEIDELKK